MDAALEGRVLIWLAACLVVVVLIGGLILRRAVQLVARFSPSYSRACLTVLVGSAVGLAISFLLGLVMESGTSSGAVDPSEPSSIAGMVSGVVGMVVGFLINTVVVNWMLRRPDGSAMGYGRAALAVLFYMVMFLVLAVIVGVIVFAIFGGGVMSAIPGQ